ncbi:MAG: CoA-acylating methylmalonate-semialdehyde dehydrogenase [Acidobacteria bacterium]|nr:CoA-acylating methylmalonate-semialdehyde dehydrogenase [Acidobacteriota bacterium]
MQQGEIMNYIGGQWRPSESTEFLNIDNPATAEVLGRVPLSTRPEVDDAAEAAALAFEDWRRTPPIERIQYLFKLKELLEKNLEEIAKTITKECGKTLTESLGELRRGIENVEVGTGIPSLMMGYNLEDVAEGIDEFMIRQPVGVVAAISPFNFPVMIPLWFLPYAIACGNTFICKPSEKVPLSMQMVFELIHESGLPRGVVNLVNGGKETVDAILEHSKIRAISFVGSSAVAQHVYAQAAAHGKRVQSSGGAKNVVIVLPDAEMEITTQVVTDSVFGCAGQRCLATPVVITVGEATELFTERIVEAASSRKVGYGLDPSVDMGPVITHQSKERMEGIIQKAASEGAEILVDGRCPTVEGYPNGYFVGPTILDSADSLGEVACTELFGPVLSLMHVSTIEEAIECVNNSPYGNMACLFTSNGAAARKFRYEALAGNIGINIGVAAPMPFFPFSGCKNSFFGDLHPQGRDAIEFFTEKKVVVERWL